MGVVTTLFVLASRRGSYHTDDLAAAIKAGSRHSYAIVIVDITGQLPETHDDLVHRIPTPLPEAANDGFHRAAGIKWAIEQGISFPYVISLSDETILTGPGLDHWVHESLRRDNLGCTGVLAGGDFNDAFRASLNCLYDWSVPHDRFERAPPVFVDDVLFMSERFVAGMFQLKLLTPEGCEAWPTTYGAYISWVCHMVGLYTLGWGHSDRQMPPLYVNRTQLAVLPPPHILAARFLVFAPASTVLSYCESDLREMFKRSRNEPAREIPPITPVVSPKLEPAI